jgi:hypothetical protein
MTDTFGNNPVTVGTPVGTPVGTAYVPNTANGDLTPIEGIAINTDSGSPPRKSTAIRLGLKDGDDATQGSQADAAWSGSGSGSLIAILKKIVAGQTGAATVVQSTGAAQGTSWRVAGDYTEQASLSAGSLNADLIPATDVSAYKYIIVQLSGTWTATLQMQVSNDNVNYPDVVAGITPQGLAGISTAPIVSLTTNHLYIFPVVSRYARLRITLYTSGTVNGVAEFHTTPSPLIQMGVSAAQNGAWTTQPISGTTGGASDFHLVSAATNNATNIKASAGTVYGYEIFNNHATLVRYVKLYNKATAPAPATDVPFRTIGIPAQQSARADFGVGLALGTGIGVATVTGISDTDNTSVAASDLVIDIAWK